MNTQNSEMLYQLAKEKYGDNLMHSALWGSATALLTDEQAEIIKSVMEK